MSRLHDEIQRAQISAAEAAVVASLKDTGLAFDEPAPAVTPGKAQSKDATVRVILRADSGYTSESTARISPAQWGMICTVMADQPCAMVSVGLAGAIADIAAERVRQVSLEGYGPEHDDEHVRGEIAAMAALYAMPDGAREWSAESTGYGATPGEAMLPDGWRAKFSDRRRDLVKAGALILAEIERLDRLEGGA
jgi:hypothetical protein